MQTIYYVLNNHIVVCGTILLTHYEPVQENQTDQVTANEYSIKSIAQRIHIYLKDVNTDFELARKSVYSVNRILSHLAIYLTKIVYITIQINIYNSEYKVSNTVNYFMPDRLPILNYNLSL